jgi:catechol 2,3-dioxygenase-like lactoylglutathione lyase family enzyme
MIRGIHHVAMSTPDLDRMRHFYHDLHGFEIVAESSWPAGSERIDRLSGFAGSAGHCIMMRKGNAYFELLHYTSPAPRPADPQRRGCDHGITHICLAVADIDTEYERLRAAGMRFHCAPQDTGTTRTTVGRDPDGNIIELQQVVDPTSPIAELPPRP